MPGLVVRPSVIARHVERELPFMATEAILMAGVRAGGDRQDLHERIRVHSVAAAEALKDGADRNDLLDRLKADPAFAAVDLDAALAPSRFIGRCPEQVDAFLAAEVAPIRRRYPGAARPAEGGRGLIRLGVRDPDRTGPPGRSRQIGPSGVNRSIRWARGWPQSPIGSTVRPA